MRKLIVLLSFLIPLIASSQVWQLNNLKYGHQYKGLRADSVFILPITTPPTTNWLSTGATRYQLADSSVYVWTGSQWRQIGSGGGGGSTDTTSLSNRIDEKVDSVTFSNDSAFYHTNGTSYYIGNIASAAAGGDTTVFEIVLDSTGQQNTRVLYAKNNKIASDDRFFYDETNNKLVINAPNISVGGPNTKLFVSGNSNITGTATVGALSVGSLTGILKGTSGTVSTATAGTDYQSPITLTTTGSSGAATLIANTLNIPQYSGGGSQTLQQTLTTGSTLTQTNTINNGGYLQTSSNGKNKFDSVAVNPETNIADSIFFSGTSITAGVGASTTGNRFSTRVAQKLGTLENNRGCSGCSMWIEGITTELPKIPTYVAGLHRWAVLEWGTNDINLGVTDTATYAAAYLRYLDTMIARGWPVAKILILNPAYLSSPSDARQTDFQICTEDIAERKGTMYLNLRPIAIARGGGVFYADGVHPGDYGVQEIYVKPISAKLGNNVRAQGQELQINGLSEIRKIKLKGLDTIASGGYFVPLALDSVGNMIILDRTRFIENSRYNPIAQPVSYNITGDGTIGGLLTTNYGRFVGGAPSGMTGPSVEIGYTGGAGYIYAYDRTGSLGKVLNINTIGGGQTNFGGSVSFASGITAGNYLQAQGGLPSTGSGVEIATYLGYGYFGAYNRTGGSALNLTFMPLGGSVFFGALAASGSNSWQFTGNGHFGKLSLGQTATPTAYLHLGAGTATASTAPLKFTSGTNLTTPENGAVEYNGTDYFVTSGGVRYTLQRVTTVPASAGATGVTGSIAYDSGFIYVCVATDTWVRAALATW